MEKVYEFIAGEKDRYLKELIEFLRIPSVSSNPDNKDDMKKCGDWLTGHLRDVGFEDVRVLPTAGHPIIYAEWMDAGPQAPVVLVYGHYDVQPVDPLELWETPPFEPQVREGYIFGRGTADDKGQVFTHIKSLEAFFRVNGKLPVNVKLLIEGEEEAAVSHLDEFIKQNAKMLACDVAVVSDTEWFAKGLPSICYGLRGISMAEVTVTGPDHDLHSGSFGGAVDNPVDVLCRMIASLKDIYGRITVEGFYDDVRELTVEERKDFEKLPFDLDDYCRDIGVPGLWGEHGYSTLERVWSRPSLDLNGIWGGYTGEGSKTILPTKASAKISMRLVPHQKAEDIAEKIKKHLAKIAPPTVRVEVNSFAGGNPVLVHRDSIAVEAAIAAFKKAFGKDPVFMREGGSIPIVELFDSVLHAPTALLGLGLPSDNIHAPNENFLLDNFFGGITASAAFFDEISRKKKK